MSTYHLQIRVGRRDDAPFMAPLIMAALGIEKVNPNHLMVLSNVCAQKNVLYSYHNTLVAEWDGKPVGILISYDGGNYASWREATFAPLQQTAGVDFDQMQDETKEGEWYFDTLSILSSLSATTYAISTYLGLSEPARRWRSVVYGMYIKLSISLPNKP